MWSTWSTIFSTVALSVSTKAGAKFIPMTPPWSARPRIMSSVRFLGWSQRFLQLLWLAMNGPFITSATSQKTVSARWETSKIIPSLSISSSA